MRGRSGTVGFADRTEPNGSRAVQDSTAAVLSPWLERDEPGVEHPKEQLCWQFAQQARACDAFGSALYTELLAEAIGDLHAEGVTWRLTRDHIAPGRGRAIALRVMAAVHRLVLSGEAPSLTPWFAATGGSADPTTCWPTFQEVLEGRESDLIELVKLGCQTNETGRAASLILGYLHVANRTRLPMTVIEIGSAAGLNLRWDHFHVSGGGSAFGDPASPVDLTGFWVDPGEVPDVDVEVVARTAVDREPLDPTTDEGRLALASSVWGDQAGRLARLDGAIELARRIQVTTVQADAVEWVESNLATTPGTVTVLVQSVLREYLGHEANARLDAAVAAVGAGATTDAPLGWIQLEPTSVKRRHGLTVATWPGGAPTLFTTASSLGPDVRRVGA
jgi:hypothetical protein